MRSWRVASQPKATVCNATRINYNPDVRGAIFSQVLNDQLFPEAAAGTVPFRQSVHDERNNIVPSRWTGSNQDSRDAILRDHEWHAAGRGQQHALDPRQLTALITNCSDWRSMQALLHRHAQNMNAIHLSALVTRLAKVVTPGSPQAGLDIFLQDVSSLVSRSLDKLDPRALANILWAVARLGFRPSHSLLQRYLFATYLALPNMQGQELANLAWAVARMQIRPGRDWLLRLHRHIIRQAHTLKPQELANLVWAIAQITADQPTQPPASAASGPAMTEYITGSEQLDDGSLQAVIAVLQQHTEKQLAGFKPQEVMMTLMALHRLHLGSRAKLSTAGPLETAGSQTLTSVLLSAGGVADHSHKHNPGNASTEHQLGKAERPGPAQPSQQQCMQQQSSQLHYSRLLQLASQQLAPQLGWLSGRDGCHLACLVAWDTQHGGSEAVWGGATGRSTILDLCRAVERHTEPFLGCLGKQGLVRLAWALAHLNARPTSAWISSYHTALSEAIAPTQSHSPSSKAPKSAAAPAPSATQTTLHTGIGAPAAASPASNGAMLVTSMWAMARLHGHHAIVDVPAGPASLLQLPPRPIPGVRVLVTLAQDDAETSITGSKAEGLVLSHELQAALAAVVPGLSCMQLARLTWALGRLQPASTAALQPGLAQVLERHIHRHMHHASDTRPAQEQGLSNASHWPAATCHTLANTCGSAADPSSSTAGTKSNTAGITSSSVGTGQVAVDVIVPVKHLGMLLSGMRALEMPTSAELLVAIACHATGFHVAGLPKQPADTAPTGSEMSSDHERPTTHLNGLAPGSTSVHSDPTVLLSLFWQLLRSHTLCNHDRAAAAQLASILVPSLAQDAHHLDPGHVYTLIRKLASTGGEGVSVEARAALVMRMSMGLRRLPPRHMVHAIVCVAQLRMQPGPNWLLAILGMVEDVMDRLTLQDMSNVLWSLAKFGMVPSRSWTSVCASTMLRLAYSPPGQPQAAGGAVAAVRSLWALHHLHIMAPRLKDRLTQIALAGLPQLSTSEALWLLRVLTSTRTMMLRSHWRKLVNAASAQGRDRPRERAARQPGLHAHQTHILRKLMQAPHMRWTRRWPTWIRIRTKLGHRHG